MSSSNSGRLREDYDGGKFVGRKEAITQAEQWRHGAKRLLTITGIPGIGKTWLVNHLVHLWDAEPNTLVKHLDLQPYIKAQRTDQPQEPFVGSPRFFEVAQQFIEQWDLGIIYEPSSELAMQIGQVAEKLCRKYLLDYIYVFLDGADDLTLDEWRIIETQLVDPLCRCENVRVIISLREIHQIHTFPLRTKEERLELKPLDKKEGYKQLSLLGVIDTQIEALLTKGYSLEHPGINFFLAQRLQNSVEFTLELINESFVRELLLALDTTYVSHPDDVEYATDLLLQLAILPDAWSFQTYCVQKELSSSEAWIELDFLQQCYLISNAPNSTQLYCVNFTILPFIRIAQSISHQE